MLALHAVRRRSMPDRMMLNISKRCVQFPCLESSNSGKCMGAQLTLLPDDKPPTVAFPVDA